MRPGPSGKTYATFLHLQCEQQRAIRRKHEQHLADALSKPTPKANIVHLHRAAPSNGKTPNTIAHRTHSITRQIREAPAFFLWSFIPSRLSQPSGPGM
jgi:hypothetical protein